MLKAVFNFEADKLLKSSKLIVPMLLLIAYIAIAYSMAPLNILSSFSICSLVLFILMISVGIMYDDLDYQMIEQTILVKLRRKYVFYLGKALLIAAVSFVFACLAVFLPLFIHMLRGSALFIREVVISDVLSGLVLFWLVGICGGMSGLFVNHRIVSNRKIAILLCIAFALFAIIRGELNQQIDALKYVTWLLPPVHDLSVAYSSDAYFQIGKTWGYFLWLLGYISAQTSIYVLVMRKRGVE